MTPKTFGLYAAVVGWHDGDTFYGAVDQGFGIFRAAGMRVLPLAFGDAPASPRIVLEPARHRINGIDTAELSSGSAAAEATRYVATLVPPGIYPAVSYKPDSFGRPLVDLMLPDGRMLAQVMIDSGFAVPYRR